MTELVIKIDWIYFFGIIGVIITIAWAFSGRISKIENTISWIRNAIKDIKCRLDNHDAEIGNMKINICKYGKSDSPMKPNNEGDKLLKNSGFYANYDKIKKLVFPVLDSYKTRTLYDAEKNTLAVFDEFKDNPIFDDMKNYSVNHPDKPLELIFTIASWIIRDDYAKERNITK